MLYNFLIMDNIDTSVFGKVLIPVSDNKIILPYGGSNGKYVATGYFIGIKSKDDDTIDAYFNNIDKGTLKYDYIVKPAWIEDISLHNPDNTNIYARQIYINYNSSDSNKSPLCRWKISLDYNGKTSEQTIIIQQEANTQPQQKYITFKINWNNLQSINGFMNEFYGIDLCTSVPFWPNNGGTPPNLTQTNGTGSGTGGFVPTPGGDGVDQGAGGSNGSQEGNYYICTKPIYTNNTVDAIIPISNGYAPSSIKIPNEQQCYLIIRTSHIYVYKTIEALKLQPNATITIESTDGSFWTSST